MNSVNPLKLLQLKNAWDQFSRRHPKFPAFLSSVTKGAITEGTILEINITTADGRLISSNLKFTAEDMELIDEIKSLIQSQGQ